MTVYLLVREDQNEHGFVDTDVIGVYSGRAGAKARESAEADRARSEGLRVEADAGVADGEWEVAFSVREQELT